MCARSQTSGDISGECWRDQVGLVDGVGEAAGAGPGPLEEVCDTGAQRVGVPVGGLGGAGQGPGIGDGHWSTLSAAGVMRAFVVGSGWEPG